jgi:hypothetical protein
MAYEREAALPPTGATVAAAAAFLPADADVTLLYARSDAETVSRARCSSSGPTRPPDEQPRHDHSRISTTEGVRKWTSS